MASSRLYLNAARGKRAIWHAQQQQQQSPQSTRDANTRGASSQREVHVLTPLSARDVVDEDDDYDEDEASSSEEESEEEGLGDDDGEDRELAASSSEKQASPLLFDELADDEDEKWVAKRFRGGPRRPLSCANCFATLSHWSSPSMPWTSASAINVGVREEVDASGRQIICCLTCASDVGYLVLAEEGRRFVFVDAIPSTSALA